jgi:hypothetical protein
MPGPNLCHMIRFACASLSPGDEAYRAYGCASCRAASHFVGLGCWRPQVVTAPAVLTVNDGPSPRCDGDRAQPSPTWLLFPSPMTTFYFRACTPMALWNASTLETPLKRRSCRIPRLQLQRHRRPSIDTAVGLGTMPPGSTKTTPRPNADDVASQRPPSERSTSTTSCTRTAASVTDVNCNLVQLRISTSRLLTSAWKGALCTTQQAVVE